MFETNRWINIRRGVTRPCDGARDVADCSLREKTLGANALLDLGTIATGGERCDEC